MLGQIQTATQQNGAATGQVEILAKLKGDLKTAMKAKNTVASTVIRVREYSYLRYCTRTCTLRAF